MARIPKLDAAGKFLAADVNAQIDARTKATMRADLPALAKELKIGGSSTGGVYYDKAGKAVPYVHVVSDTDPGKTKVIDGQTYEVWWVQTTPPDPMQSTPIGVTQDLAARSYTVPSDPVATYTVDGVAKAAGTYSVSAAAQTIQWAAVAKPGYGFKAGVTASGSLVFPLKTYAVGDVLMSDSFARASNTALFGTNSDSFEGGESYMWVGEPIAPGAPVVEGGMVKPGASGVFHRPQYRYSTPQTNVRVEWVWGQYPSNTNPLVVTLATGKTIAVGTNIYSNEGGTTNIWYTGNVSATAGQRLAFYTTGDPEIGDGQTWTLHNLTTGVKSSGTAGAAGGVTTPTTRKGAGYGKITGVYWDIRTDTSQVGWLDAVKVVTQ